MTADSANWSVRASNKAGYAESHAKLTVLEVEPVIVNCPPTLVKGLADINYPEGSSAELKCQFEGHPTPSVSWFKNGVCIDRSRNYTIGEFQQEQVLRIDKLMLEDASEYGCEACNSLGKVSTRCQLTVSALEPTQLPCFEEPLINADIRTGEPLVLECEVKGLPRPEVTWHHLGRQVKKGPSADISYNGATAKLIIGQAFPKHGGHYVCKAKNKAGEATSTCQVTVKAMQPPAETSDSEAQSDADNRAINTRIKPAFYVPLKNLTVTEGEEVVIECVIASCPEAEVNWYRNGVLIQESPILQTIRHGDSCKLVLKAVETDMGGEFRVRATNELGDAQSTCQVWVEPSIKSKGHQPRITCPVQATTTAEEGLKVVLQCSFEAGDRHPKVTWMQDGKPVVPRHDVKVEVCSNTASIVFSKIKEHHRGQYSCRIENADGSSVFSSGDVVVKKKRLPPVFLRRLQPILIEEGQRMLAEVEIGGTPAPRVHWYKNNQQLSSSYYMFDKSGPCYAMIIDRAVAADTGTYAVRAVNEAGEDSCMADFEVRPPLPAADDVAPPRPPSPKTEPLSVLANFNTREKPLPELLPFPFKPDCPGVARVRGSQAPRPSKFTPGAMYHSDYESDWEGTIRPKWRAYDSESETMVYKKVNPDLKEGRRGREERKPSPPCPHMWESHEEIQKLEAELARGRLVNTPTGVPSDELSRTAKSNCLQEKIATEMSVNKLEKPSPITQQWSKTWSGNKTLVQKKSNKLPTSVPNLIHGGSVDKSEQLSASEIKENVSVQENVHKENTTESWNEASNTTKASNSFKEKSSTEMSSNRVETSATENWSNTWSGRQTLDQKQTFSVPTPCIANQTQQEKRKEMVHKITIQNQDEMDFKATDSVPTVNYDACTTYQERLTPVMMEPIQRNSSSTQKQFSTTSESVSKRVGTGFPRRSETPLKEMAKRLEEQMLASGAMSPPPPPAGSKQMPCLAKTKTDALLTPKAGSPFHEGSTVDETSHNTTQSTVIHQSSYSATTSMKEEFVSVKEKIKILEQKVEDADTTSECSSSEVPQPIKPREIPGAVRVLPPSPTIAMTLPRQFKWSSTCSHHHVEKRSSSADIFNAGTAPSAVTRDTRSVQPSPLTMTPLEPCPFKQDDANATKVCNELSMPKKFIASTKFTNECDDYAEYASDSCIVRGSATWRPKTGPQRTHQPATYRPVKIKLVKTQSKQEKNDRTPTPPTTNLQQQSAAMSSTEEASKMTNTKVTATFSEQKSNTMHQFYESLSSRDMLPATSPYHMDSCASTLERSEAYHSSCYKSCEENQVTDSELEQLNGFLTAPSQVVKKSVKSPTVGGRKSLSPKSKQRTSAAAAAAGTATNRGDGYEADTDDTLSRQQQRKSVKELARSFQEAENACPSPIPLKPKFFFIESDYDTSSDVESRPGSRWSSGKTPEPSKFMSSKAYVPPKWLTNPPQHHQEQQQETISVVRCNQKEVVSNRSGSSDTVKVRVSPVVFNPTKFVPGTFQDSVWSESCFTSDTKIQPKWRPPGGRSDNSQDMPQYRRIQPKLS